ncbi:centromere protein P isoform X3 [Molossus molossus]|uniref:centromere protein P isoform X3 n=1 Tax=Molossus molossus TaxID=27622 RepID=UPI0017477629|nr:centromere protein P isoform X3 [Molossus molossus]
MSTEMTEKGIQRHKLSGNCQMITFQVEFQILEVQTKENLSTVITDLNIIMESTTYPELSEFVSRAEERRALFMFFRSLHCFVEWCEYQKRTFKHFKLLGTTTLCSLSGNLSALVTHLSRIMKCIPFAWLISHSIMCHGPSVL